jgi:seryl-tRNA synthetase
MHDIRFIREHPAEFDRKLRRRNLADDEKKDFSSQNLLSIDEHRRAVIRTLERWQATRNAASKDIGQAKAKRDDSKVQDLMAQVAEAKESISNLEREEKEIGERLDKILERIPNLPLDDVPDGKDANDNVEHHRFGAKCDYAFSPKQHFELGEALGQMDFGIAAKLSGARFVVLKKDIARLERAISQFMLDMHTSEPHNYTEVSPPLLVRDEVMFGTAQLPKFGADQFYALSTLLPKKAQAQFFELEKSLSEIEETEREMTQREAEFENYFGDVFKEASISDSQRARLEKLINSFLNQLWEARNDLTGLRRDEIEYLRAFATRLWLIPTAEVPLTNLVRESILDEAQLPMRFTACTPCFRAEAGAAGKDTRGMIRQHQFTKVELVSITTPEQSKDEHERMLACAEEVLRRLDLHYRVMTLCAGDMGFPSQKTYDIEVWLPGQNMYREISSCSVCGEFQARRMNARYRTKEGRQIRHVHTLNGSGVAVGRALIAVMETYQQEDGSIAVPDVLQGYMGGIKKIEKS